MKPVSSNRALQFWGGVECTLNRVGVQYFDQMSRSGHRHRMTDLDLIAELGIRTIRYSALWEMATPDGSGHYDWSWIEQRLTRLRQLGITPIVGFLHHGSGPPGCDLLSPDFATAFEAYASAFAQRFPWVEYYTPINEPLTTARFSALYGHWYPHRSDDTSFVTACLNQYRATSLAMRAIRQVRSDARLVQTEDLGKTFSSPGLAYQAEFENHRRWLTFDVLTGRVDRSHPMTDYLQWTGVSAQDLEWFVENACAPDILGINYYVTSERYLDEHVSRYPRHIHGGNGRHAYADVEAVRARKKGLAGVRSLLLEAWQRFSLPLAVTEVHLHCGREDQLRWLWEIWQEAHAARNEGADVRAITSWSLFGAFDWDSLVTQQRGHYESGAFDVRGPTPRPTAVAGLIRELTSGQTPTHPLLSQPGWWRRDNRQFQWTRASHKRNAQSEMTPLQGQPVLITGANGRLGRAFSRICLARGIPCRLLSRQEMDIADAGLVELMLEQVQPWVVVNAAGYTRVNEAEKNVERCHRENVHGPLILATACKKARLPLVTFSSDLVFDGRQRSPYSESDAVNPLGVYGRTKAEGEQRVLDSHPDALVVRTSVFFSPWDELNFVALLRRIFQNRQPCEIFDGVVSPTYLPDLVHACLDLAIDRASGIWHLAGQGETSWADLAEEIALRSGLNRGSIDLRIRSVTGVAPRPVYSALRTERGLQLPSWESGLDRCFQEMAVF
jgi:dTDP-4-dehydrorhamnose reductase